MPYSSGTYSLPSGNPVVTGTTISSSTTNTTNSDIATALSTCVLKDGTQTITANLPMASHKLTGLSAGTTAGDSVEYGGSPSFTNLAYTGTLTGSTGILNIGSGQLYKDASGNVGVGTSSPAQKLDVVGNISATGSLNSINTFGFKNRIINGGMAIDQRNAGAAQTILNSTAVYAVDRMLVSAVGGNATGQRSAGTLSQYNYKITGGAGISQATLSQRIESNNIYDLAGQVVTLSVNLSNSLLTTISWTANYPTAVDNYASTTTIASGSFTVTSTETRYSTQITLPSGAQNGLQITFYVGAQTSGTFTVGQVQLEKGSVATSFDQRAYSQELAMCQRYFSKSFLQGTAPVQNSGSFSGTAGIISVNPVTRVLMDVCLPVVMRAAPAVTFFNPAAANAEARDANASTNCSSTGTFTIGDRNFTISTVGSASSNQGNGLSVHWTANIEL